MKQTQKRLVAVLVAGATGLIMIVGSFQSARAQGAQSNFTGGNPTSVDASVLRVIRLRFQKGSRTNWHSHQWGQLLMIEEGKGRMQVRGGPVQEMLPGRPYWFAPNVEHWHGAAPDQDALQLTIYSSEGTPTTWKGAVSDGEYLGTKR
jgi:quercetin dioxygenase-like cupin family protein